MITAYSYIRFSTIRQADGDSLRRQASSFDAYCEKNKLAPSDLKLSDLGVSGFRGANAKKGRLAFFLQAIESGKVKPGEVLVVESLDRLGRQEPLAAMDIFSAIVRAGVKIVTLSDGQEYTKESIRKNPAQLFIVMAVMIRANEESETKSMRVRAAIDIAQKLAKENGTPMNAKTPCWIRLDKTAKSFSLIADKAAIVRRIVDMGINGLGTIRIARQLNKEKVPTFGKKNWGYNIIQHILYSRTLIGELQLAQGRNKNTLLGEPIKNYYPPVISEAMFYKLQNAMTGRKKCSGGRGADNVTNLFGRQLIDAATNSHCVIVRKKERKYVIPSAYQYQRQGKYNTFPYEVLETQFLKWVTEVKLTADKPTASKADEKAGRLAEIEKKIGKTEKAMEAAGDDGFDTYLSILGKLKGQAKIALAEFEAEKAKEQATTVTPKELRDIVKVMDNLPPNERLAMRHTLRAKIATLVKSIRLFIHAVPGQSNRVALAVVEFSDGTLRLIAMRAYRNGNTPMKSYGINLDWLAKPDAEKLTAPNDVLQEFTECLAETDVEDAEYELAWLPILFNNGHKKYEIPTMTAA